MAPTAAMLMLSCYSKSSNLHQADSTRFLQVHAFSGKRGPTVEDGEKPRIEGPGVLSYPSPSKCNASVSDDKYKFEEAFQLW